MAAWGRCSLDTVWFTQPYAQNPLEVEPTTIKDIPVVETIKDGRTIFQAGRRRK